MNKDTEKVTKAAPVFEFGIKGSDLPTVNMGDARSTGFPDPSKGNEFGIKMDPRLVSATPTKK